MGEVETAIAAVVAGRTVQVSDGCPRPTDATMGQLTSTDQIVIVVLPEGAGDPAAIAARIDAATGGEKIIAVVVGDQMSGTASRFERGTAEGIAERAASLTRDPMAAVKVFVEKVHAYQATEAGQQAMQPRTETVTTTPSTPEPATPANLGLIGAIVIGSVALAAVGYRHWRRASTQQRPAQVEAKLQSRLAATAKRWDDNPAALTFDDVTRSIADLSALASGEAAAVPGSSRLAEVTRLSASIAGSLEAIRDEWDRVCAEPLLAAEIRDITFRHLPETVGLYLQVPARVRHSKVRSDTPAGSLRDALDAVDHRLAEVRDALDSRSLEALEVQGRFLKGKYVPHDQFRIQ